MSSLRRRLVLGAVLWTVGLAAATNAAILHVMRHVPGQVLHYGAMTVFALGLLGAALALARTGMSLLDELRARLAEVRHGRERRLTGSYFDEVQPLVDDLNALLDDRERSVARAQATAGDLAHGLKTPLAVLAQEAERTAAAGNPELAATIGQQVERMRRQIDYHLARARAGTGAALGVRCSVDESAEAIARTLRRLHAERGLAIEVRVAAGHAVRCRREDLDEMLGNLLDNACKWARASVAIESSLAGARVVIAVDDDGAGLEPKLREAVLQRGVRADEAAPGSGLGLAIVRELAELYGGSIGLEASPRGGLRARLELPAA